MTGKEIRRLEIDELLAYAQTGEDERVEAALELLRRRQAKQLRKRSKPKPKLRPQEHTLESVRPLTGPDT
jgi:hypothetical protein